MSSLLGNRGRLLSFCMVISSAMLIGSCSGSSLASSSSIPTPARASIPTASAADGDGATASGDLKRTSQGGNVTLEVTWDKDVPAADSLQFKVVMDTHSVNLDGVDLGRLAVLRNDAGKEVSPERWDAPAGGHHRSGTIAFPATAGGSALIGPQTKFIQMVVRDVAGVKERSFKWELSS